VKASKLESLEAYCNPSSTSVSWGFLGACLAASAPIVLHPLLVIGLLAGISNYSLVLAVLVGRTAKYLVMASLAIRAPELLKFFGVSRETLKQLSPVTG